MTAEKMWIFNCGWIEVENSLIMYREEFGKKQIIPITAILVKSIDGYLLFDSGLNIDVLEEPSRTLGLKAKTIVEFDEDHGIQAHLSAVGVNPGDIRWLVNSHLHWDHTGGNAHVAPKEMIVQREELRFSMNPDLFVEEVYLKSQFNLQGNLTIIDGDYVVTNGIGLINTRGHTPGHQSLLVRMPSGSIYLGVGDAAYCQENISKSWPPGNAWSMPDAHRAIQHLSFISNFYGAELIIGHDPNLWKRGGPRIRELF